MTSGFLVLTAFRHTDKTSDEGAPILSFDPASIIEFSCLSRFTENMSKNCDIELQGSIFSAQT